MLTYSVNRDLRLQVRSWAPANCLSPGADAAGLAPRFSLKQREPTTRMGDSEFLFEFERLTGKRPSSPRLHPYD